MIKRGSVSEESGDKAVGPAGRRQSRPHEALTRPRRLPTTDGDIRQSVEPSTRLLASFDGDDIERSTHPDR